VAEACAAFVASRGGLFRVSERVQRILVEDGRAVGIETATGRIRARAVVSNAGIQPTVLALAGAEHFPVDYVERVRALEPSWAIAGIRYVFDAEVFDAALIPVYSDESWLDDARFAAMVAGRWPDVPLIAVDVASQFDPGLVAEPGRWPSGLRRRPGDGGRPWPGRVVDELTCATTSCAQALRPGRSRMTVCRVGAGGRPGVSSVGGSTARTRRSASQWAATPAGAAGSTGGRLVQRRRPRRRRLIAPTRSGGGSAPRAATLTPIRTKGRWLISWCGQVVDGGRQHRGPSPTGSWSRWAGSTPAPPGSSTPTGSS
jgi:hypothetical protein